MYLVFSRVSWILILSLIMEKMSRLRSECVYIYVSVKKRERTQDGGLLYRKIHGVVSLYCFTAPARCNVAWGV